jgi:lipopolysaccharide transport system ATP-binding protein
VSHDAEAVRLLCEQAVWIDRGVMRASGTAEAVVDAYLAASTG